HALGSKRRRDGHFIPEGLKRPGQHPLRTPTLCGQLHFCDLVFHAIGSSSAPRRGACERNDLKSTAGSKLSCTGGRSGTTNSCATVAGSAKRTTSPTTSSVGEASCGARCRSSTVVRCVR